MARGVNKVILIGNLGGDPDVRFTPNGSAVANLNVATSESWTDKNTGQRQDRTEWHRVVVFGKLAEICQQYLRKGSKVYLEGKLQTRKWQDQQGQDRYTTEVVVDSFGGQMQMLDSRQDAGMGAAPNPIGGGYQQQPQASQNRPSQQPQPYTQPHSAPAPAPASSQPSRQQQPQQQSPQQQPQTAPQPATAGFDDFDDDIPF